VDRERLGGEDCGVDDIGILAAILLTPSLVSRRQRPSASAPMVFIAAAIALGPHVLELGGFDDQR